MITIVSNNLRPNTTVSPTPLAAERVWWCGLARLRRGGHRPGREEVGGRLIAKKKIGRAEAEICVLIHLGQRESGNGGLGNIMNSKTVDTEMATGVAECQQVSN